MHNVWKIACVALLYFTLFAGFLMPVPELPILNESIRNLYFHVTMWFAMIIHMVVTIVYSIRYLSGGKIQYDLKAEQYAITGMVFGIAGLITGMIWARFTWGAFWVNDTKLNGAAAAMLMYAAYFILRQSTEDETKRAKLSAVYLVFAFPLMMAFIYILPRMTDSLHPGNGGNPAFGQYDLDNQMRLVFYPAIIGWTLLGVWITSIRIRIKKLWNSHEN
ncbi:MAG TPA: cytochrome c biogenesis protein CcsA [Bacteroidia bacterium]|nr:cytochrome c biogenesis protein CcsA [Bacteroidia bacterium]QQR94438.1 MAG: cytochrome c biogenesis protein CcsA [Bacteroidota bacterium]MBP7714024.1 cytochrome c biogenesis protein CcsA [Bacteroidia bacterium]MBP8667703.1 cytochrome c biogenesis protein CcsA [Bacteroidia bacterium]HOZ83300.1 cytochrome c biogenesis protein CcsA [Bacteroidia bacterium]